MKSVNKVTMLGVVVRDPEVTQINENTDVAKFSVALNESYKKPSGETVETTTYVDCEAWGGLSKVIGNYVKKGSKLYIEGALRADVWQDADTGKNRTKYKVRVNDLVMLDSKNSGGGDNGGSGYQSQGQNQNSDQPKVNAVDDDLPF